MRALTAALLLRRAAVSMPIGFDPASAADGRPAGPIPEEATRLAARRRGYGESAWIGAAAERLPEGDRMPRRKSARWSR